MVLVVVPVVVVNGVVVVVLVVVLVVAVDVDDGNDGVAAAGIETGVIGGEGGLDKLYVHSFTPPFKAFLSSTIFPLPYPFRKPVVFCKKVLFFFELLVLVLDLLFLFDDILL